jgi:HlyD family secretion protein
MSALQGRLGEGRLPLRRRTRMTLGSTMLLGALALAACTGAQQRQASQTATMPVRRGSISQNVSSSGQIAALRDSALTFVTSGTVATVNVAEGQQVQAGDVLAALDTADLEQGVVQAQANLKSAQADLTELKAGPGKTELLTAQNQVKGAQIDLDNLTKGNATAGELASARAQLRAAQANLNALKNPTEDDRQEAQQAVQEAETNLQSTRDKASLSKTQAEIQLRQSTYSLTQTQASYGTAKSNWEFVQATNQDPSNPESTDSAGNKTENKLTDGQRQQYYDAYIKAEASLHSAEDNVKSAQLSYDNARQQEVIDIQNAEQQLATAQRQLKALLNPTPAAVASAEAQVLQAQNQLAQLTGSATASDLANAQMTLEERQAALEDLQAPPTDAELAQREAAVAQAEAALAEAQRNLQDGQLVAPFDSTVAAVNITPGDSTAGESASSNADASTAAVYLIDTSSFYVDVNISEVDLAQLDVGQAAKVTIDALPGAAFTGKLDYVALTPTVEQNVTTYAARVGLDPSDQQLRVGMSAAVTIEIAGRNDVLLVPNIAIQQGRDGTFVTVRKNGQDTRTSIKTGLAGDSQTEVLEGLSEGDEIVITVANSTGNTGNFVIGGPPGGGAVRTGGGGGGGGGGGNTRP